MSKVKETVRTCRKGKEKDFLWIFYLFGFLFGSPINFVVHLLGWGYFFHTKVRAWSPP